MCMLMLRRSLYLLFCSRDSGLFLQFCDVQDSLSARVWSRFAVCKIRCLQNSLSARFADCDMQDSRYYRVVRRHFVSTDLRCRCNFCRWIARGGASRQGCCTSSSRPCKKVQMAARNTHFQGLPESRPSWILK